MKRLIDYVHESEEIDINSLGQGAYSILCSIELSETEQSRKIFIDYLKEPLKSVVKEWITIYKQNQ